MPAKTKAKPKAKPKDKPKAKRKPKANGQAGKATAAQRKGFKLDAALSRMAAFSGAVTVRCTVSHKKVPFSAYAWIGGNLRVGSGSSAGQALKRLWEVIADDHDLS